MSRSAAVAALIAVAVALPAAPAAVAAPSHSRGAPSAPRATPRASRATPRAPRATPRASRATPRAPSGPPLLSGEGAFATPSEGEEAVAPSTSRPLVANGLGSPLCSDRAALPAAARENCLTSGFVAAAAPTGNYGLDVHIETGVPDFKGEAAAFVEDYMIKPPWTALVWAVHALLAAMQWAYLLDILHSPAMGTVAEVLRTVQQTVTTPWLAVVLAIASVLIAYRGIVKRRVADTLGEALAILAMMAAGLWMIADPLGTVGAVASFADAASLQTLAAVSTGTNATPDEALSTASGQVFGATVDGPWCYLEFGNVSWCEDPARLDGSLRAAGLKIAAAKRSQAAGAVASAARGEEAARLLRSAVTNGEVFLSLASNQPERNSINDEGSLLRTLCKSPSLSTCTGPTAAEAEFRDEGNLLNRCAGLALIAGGALGMILLLGFIVTRLLGAALFSLLLLLAAPVVVLMPALGETGRARYRDWAGRLLCAVVTKLIWSFLLGVVLVAMKLVLVLHGLGWWMQWLTLTVLWWWAFRRRHDMLGLARIGRDGSARADSAGRRTALGKAGSRAGTFAWGLMIERSRIRRRSPTLPPGGRDPKPTLPGQAPETSAKTSFPREQPSDGQKKPPDGRGQPERTPPGGGREPGGARVPAGSPDASQQRPSDAQRQNGQPGGSEQRSEGLRKSAGGGWKHAGSAPKERSKGPDVPPAGRRQDSPEGPQRRSGAQSEPSGGRTRSEASRQAGGGTGSSADSNRAGKRHQPAAEQRGGASAHRVQRDGWQRDRAEAPDRHSPAAQAGGQPGGEPGGQAAGAQPPAGRAWNALSDGRAPASAAEQQSPGDSSRARLDEVVRRIREDAAARRGAGPGSGAAGPRDGASGRGASGEGSRRADRARRRRRQLGEG